jgi:hypothetical protein
LRTAALDHGFADQVVEHLLAGLAPHETVATRGKRAS